jgi:hypothetical protein
VRVGSLCGGAGPAGRGRAEKNPVRTGRTSCDVRHRPDFCRVEIQRRRRTTWRCTACMLAPALARDACLGGAANSHSSNGGAAAATVCCCQGGAVAATVRSFHGGAAVTVFCCEEEGRRARPDSSFSVSKATMPSFWCPHMFRMSTDLNINRARSRINKCKL